MSLVAVNGERYYVNCDGRGTPLLLLHGFTGGSTTWQPLLPRWRGAFWTIAVDLLGHGQSAAPADPVRYGMDATVADLAALLNTLGIGRAQVLGYSLGGRVALHFAATHPERVDALVLESASPGLATAAERAARVAADTALAASIQSDGVPAFVDAWERLPLWASQARLPAAARADLRAARLRNRPAGLANSLRGIGTGAQAPLHDRLPGLEMPVLLIAGAEDAKFSAIARAMATALPDAELAIIPDAGHCVHLEQPAVFAERVALFLGRRDTRPAASYSSKGEHVACL
ncbi:MAG TPA: 2-succinyl-6-hydroxy-2,4-cyclohexadiene-1-carboxylate synthase [Chloroflexia bacterium]|nr:2-succinyl-6-hydroxy-2,4-cyclohexadiene-1-carboxylate synthase [Chloroflexia bacterium]